ncbi:MAG TPA: DUF6286 domain-containing protein [Mycobacteriales bacterium]|nr:DUF6286 domain-containing protein [Mycobacteriales bacterium]
MTLFDRAVSTVLALALLAFGLLVAAEVVHTALGFGGHLVFGWQGLARFGERHTWDSSVIRLISAVVAGVGLVLAAAEARRRRPGLLSLVTDDDLVTAATTRRGLRRALSTQAVQVAGVASARTRLRRRTATVHAVTGWRDPGDLSDRLAAELGGWLDGLGLARPPRLAVRLRVRAD